jgi:hypothetical protein
MRVDRAFTKWRWTRPVVHFSVNCVHKMRWLGNVSIDNEYRSMDVYLEMKEEVDRSLQR